MWVVLFDCFGGEDDNCIVFIWQCGYVCLVQKRKKVCGRNVIVNYCGVLELNDGGNQMVVLILISIVVLGSILLICIMVEMGGWLG